MKTNIEYFNRWILIKHVQKIGLHPRMTCMDFCGVQRAWQESCVLTEMRSTGLNTLISLPGTHRWLFDLSSGTDLQCVWSRGKIVSRETRMDNVTAPKFKYKGKQESLRQNVHLLFCAYSLNCTLLTLYYLCISVQLSEHFSERLINTAGRHLS